MNELSRRSALTIGLGAASGTLLPRAAVSQGSPHEGREVAPGVRRVEHTKRETMIPQYKVVSMRDTVYQPGASTGGNSMPNDMVCHMVEGELMVDTGSGENLYRKGDVWSCAKGMPERSRNAGTSVAIMRIIDLLPS